tara:strand:- start:1265 stop:1630 length:366 start_codon:yes stop_codon:yes gene_type:complete
MLDRQQTVISPGIPFHVPEWFTRNFPSTPLDGELWTDREQFQELVSIVSRESADTDWEKVHYFVFNAPEIEGGLKSVLIPCVTGSWNTQTCLMKCWSIKSVKARSIFEKSLRRLKLLEEKG